MKTGKIEDIKVLLSVVLGTKLTSVADVASISPGSIVQLDKMAGEPVDLYAAGEPIAKGEVVVIDENFGIRITHLLDEGEKTK
jgi:flagellar motor switch protein FliN/FliY